MESLAREHGSDSRPPLPSLLDCARIVWRRRGIFVAILAALIALCVFFVWSYTPEYRATATMLIENAALPDNVASQIANTRLQLVGRRVQTTDSLVQIAEQTFGRLDVLVNNAGTTRFIDFKDIDDVKLEDWDNIFGVNVRGAFQCARDARSALEANGHGAVINVSSTASLRPLGSSIPYCASKAALNSLTATLARALAPKIRVNAVAPGFIDGEWLQQGLGAAYEATKKFWEQRNPLGRVSTPDDVASAILDLIEGGDLVTGNVLPVEGGALIAP